MTWCAFNIMLQVPDSRPIFRNMKCYYSFSLVEVFLSLEQELIVSLCQADTSAPLSSRIMWVHYACITVQQTTNINDLTRNCLFIVYSASGKLKSTE